MDNESRLTTIFNNVNQWLKFAEKKNTYVLTFFSLIVIFTPFISTLTTINTLIKVSITILYFFYLLAMICTIFSLFPVTCISKKIIERGKDKKIKEDDNLIFYGHIFKYSKEEYINSMKKYYGMELQNNKLLCDLVEQIIINSNIARNKMEYFKFSIVFTILSLSQFTVCFIINLFI
jgi:hypothetical protein